MASRLQSARDAQALKADLSELQQQVGPVVDLVE